MLRRPKLLLIFAIVAVLALGVGRSPLSPRQPDAYQAELDRLAKETGSYARAERIMANRNALAAAMRDEQMKRDAARQR